MIFKKDRTYPSSGVHARVATVLVIDDELMVAKSLERVLSGEFEVTRTTEPERALEWLSAGKSYDVILCDVMMPASTGSSSETG